MLTTKRTGVSFRAVPEAALRRRRHRSGFTLVEIMAALVILAAAMLAVVQTITAVSRQSRAAEQRALALQEAANVLERLYGRPWNELTPERAATETLSPACQQRLPKPTLKVAVQATAERPGEKRVLVELDWQDAGGDRSRPVRLTAWRFGPAEARP